MKRIYSVVLCLFAFLLFNPTAVECKESIQALQNEAGFMAIEPITFSFDYGSHFSRLELESSQARIWYSFHAADDKSTEKPLFIFFNGGPGSATSSGLMSMYTSRYTLDNTIDSGGGDVYIPNPYPWTQLGNLLYIDARQAGFSYNIMSEFRSLNDEGVRFQEFNSQNFNPFFDGADFIRVLLRFLARHPELQSNPVVIVGESYGGMRTICMLHILLNYTGYADGQEMYQDKALVAEIQAHFDAVFPQFQGQVVPPEVISAQFGHQVLIQPAISYGYQLEFTEELLRQPGSLAYQLGEEVGVPYNPSIHDDVFDFVDNVAGRDLYIYSKPQGWLGGFFGNAGTLLRYTQNLTSVTGVDVTRIDGLYASARPRGYRVFDTNYDLSLLPGTPTPMVKFHFLDPALQEAEDLSQVSGDMSAVFGALQPWDRYFLRTNYHANWAFHVFNVAKVRGYEVDIYHPRWGWMFLQNVGHVNTFVTNAPLDLVVYPYAIPPSLAMYDDILESLLHVEHPLFGEARPGYIILNYRSSAFPHILGLGTRTIRFPLYAHSCHAVSLTQPEELLEDVSSWLADHGIDVR